MFWHDHSNLPEQIKQSTERTKRAHPDCNFIFADDTACLELIRKEFPRFKELYERNTIPASRSDIARLVYLYQFGGIYLDATMAFSKSLYSSISTNDDLILVRRDDIAPFKERPEKAGVINGILASESQSVFILNCLKKVYFNLYHGIHNYAVHAASGPIVINEIYRGMENNSSVRTLSFAHLLEHHFDYLRIPGVSNQWVETQLEGIVDPCHYRAKNIIEDTWSNS